MITGNTLKRSFLEGGGEMGALTRAYDWASTSVGPVDQWPETLKATVGIILRSNFPMFLWWGDNMIQFYNDAYRPSLGNEGKHPTALGQDAVDCWPEIWDIIYPLIMKVKTNNESVYFEDMLVPIYRNGQIEDVYWTFSYSAVIGETGNIDGVLVVCNETTETVNSRTLIEKAQKRIQQSESNLRSIILQAPVAMCILKGSDHIVEIANDRILRLWGKPKEKMIGYPVFNELTEARYEGFEALLDKVLETGETYSAYGAPVTLYNEGQPQLVYIHFVYEPFRGEDGSITGVMVVAIDVTLEITAWKKLEESENKARNLIENAPFPMGLYEGREMRLSILNQSIIDAWGKGSDLIGKTFYEVLPEMKNQGVFDILDSVFTTGVPYHARNQRVDIEVDRALRQYYFNYSYIPLRDSTGKIYGVLNTAADVTDLELARQRVERSEGNFRNLVQTAPVAMCILMGPEHVVTVASDEMIRLWGKPEEQVMNKPIFMGLPDARGQGLEEIIKKVYETGELFVANEQPVDLYRDDKVETIYQNFVYEPYRDPNGNILGVTAVTIDVTAQVLARQKIEEIVKERTESLRKTNADLSQFAYITSHDLQEPARKIATFTEMLRKSLGDRVDPRSGTYLDKIEKSSTRMLSLIRDVLAFSTISNGKQDFEPVNLNEIFASVKNDHELLIEEKQAIFDYPELPVIEAIPIQMSQLFNNLLSNSLKFIPRDKNPFIRVTWKKLNEAEVLAEGLAAGSGHVQIEFSDNGIGFSIEHAEQIFNIFQRLHGRTEYEGTGIGLAICKKIAENHHGKIEAISAKGQGATFRIILPSKQTGSPGNM
ncbi:PAS domain-containing sensor histidine kinase [Flavihumibacter solisilvae]|uniref:histidine kinase n=1 Tax=Flavihumibacter solisilvae TaxID=1349421 RepID=A0A0C1L8I9_9BACT|nr:PAS domain-containing protein [Flavihumibacter solisilvae]KIC95911.1 hypothetical protein OI18_03230 [Flavihumibacter solisilvae]